MRVNFMAGTFFSFLIALMFLFFRFPEGAGSNLWYLALFFIAASALVVAAMVLASLFALSPLQKNEQYLTPRVVSSYLRDKGLTATGAVLALFFFGTYLLVADLLVFKFFSPYILLAVWTVLAGIACDVLRWHIRRITTFLDPYYVVESFGRQAADCIRKAKEVELCEWIEALTETALKATKQRSIALASLCLDKLRFVTHHYLEIAKGVAYYENEDKTKFGGADHVGYILFFIFQRLELIFDGALKEKLEPLCSKTATVLGKIAIYCAKYDITLTSYPIHYLGKLTKRAQGEGLQEVGNRALLTLQEVAKVIVKEVDLQYVEIKEAFNAIINVMHDIATDTFRNDKTISIPLLIHPFSDLKQTLQSSKLKDHRDLPAVLASVDAVINEFTTLETVLSTMPPLPKVVTEREQEIPEKEEPLTPE